MWPVDGFLVEYVESDVTPYVQFVDANAVVRPSSLSRIMQRTTPRPTSKIPTLSFQSAGCPRANRNMARISRKSSIRSATGHGIAWARSEFNSFPGWVWCTMLTKNSLAYHEMRLIMAAVMLSFDIELSKEADNWVQQDCYLLWDKPVMMAKLTVAN